MTNRLFSTRIGTLVRDECWAVVLRPRERNYPAWHTIRVPLLNALDARVLEPLDQALRSP